MATLNVARLKVQLAKDARGTIKAAATKRVNAIFHQAVDKMVEEFDEHKVTKEIEGGVGSDNISETLRGGKAPENLFSFIGFKEGSKPTEEIRKRLDPTHPAGPKMKFETKNEQKATWTFRVTAPDRKRIYAATPFHKWAKGWSWAEQIETHIPNFQRFIARFMPNASDAVSRSKGGTQATRDLRDADYTPPPNGYLNTIFNNFIGRIKDATKLGGRGRDAGGRFTPF